MKELICNIMRRDRRRFDFGKMGEKRYNIRNELLEEILQEIDDEDGE